ncbi:MAG: ATP-binding protein [Desulfobacterales bacterium]|nr:ATP-binding protein [Desulfobacterales bacterium]
MNDSGKINYNERLTHLEQVNLSRIKALDVIRELSGFTESISRLEDPATILDKCSKQMGKLVPIKTLAFYLIDEQTSDFKFAVCYPPVDKDFVESEMPHFIEDGTFSRAVLERAPVTAGSRDFSVHFLFHVLATASRVRGMCVAVLDGGPRQVPEAAFELLSILMTHCANALESYELYSRLKQANDELGEKVSQLSASRTSLQNEVGEHEKTLEALRVSESQYRLLAETARELIMTVSGDRRITYINPYGLGLTGLPPGEIEGVDVKAVLPDFDPDRTTEEELTTRLVSRGAEAIPLEITLAALPDSKGDSGFLIMGRNISERLKAEAEKDELEQRLWQARKMESIGLLAGGTAHDFNNLLSVIVNYTDLSLEVLEDGHPARKFLDRVEIASNQAIVLAKKLYTIGREDRHDTHKVDMNALMTETLSLLRSSLGKTCSLGFDEYPEPLMVEAEETRLRQVLMNLITNAAHSMEKGNIRMGGERVSIDGGSGRTGPKVEPGAYVRIWIKDTGSGIEPEVLPRIFEPYYSTKKGDSNSGLGLAVVHGIVNNYGGTVEVESTVDKGSCFYIYLPEAK